MASIEQNFYGPIEAKNVGVINPNDKSALDDLKPYVNPNAAYNSAEREQEEVTICQPGTRTRVLNRIQRWIRGDGPSILWLYGPAGAGKSTIAYTIAEQCDEDNPRSLAFSYFFSRRNTNRNDLTKFVPTVAHRLVSVISQLDQGMKKAIASDPFIFSYRLEHQVKKLITGPLREIRDQIPRMVVVIDGLDEYSDETSNVLLSQLVWILVRALADYPFRIFFASRPEPYIRAIFDKLSTETQTIMIPISDWETRDDIYKYLSSNLSEVQLRKQLPSSWPLPSDIRNLADKSEGIFIYVSTLIKFVGANNCNSRERLQKALASHSGLDLLFVQVLDKAIEHNHFQYLLGVIMFLRERLLIGDLGRFLQRDTYDIRSSFEGSLSILLVPEGDENYIRPYHTSLRDFLMDRQRSTNHFLDPVANHAALVEACESLIARDDLSNAASGDHLFYAYRNWCHHTLLILSSESSTNIDRSPLLCASEKLAERLFAQDVTCLRRMESHEEVEKWLEELLEAILYAQRGRGQFKAFIRGGRQLQKFDW